MAEEEKPKQEVTFEHLGARVSILLESTSRLIEDIREQRKSLQLIGEKIDYLMEKFEELKK